MARAVWKGSISFGLVHLPVELFNAAADKAIRFHNLHDADNARLKQLRVCSVDGKEVPYEEVVKGYELSPGEYVVFDKEELSQMAPERSKTVEIEKFVELDKVDVTLFKKTYYVVPDEAAVRPYSLLVDAMRETGRAGVATLVMNQKEHVICVWPKGDELMLTALQFADELIEPKQIEQFAVALDSSFDHPKNELDAAKALIETLAGEFDPTDYKDEYRDRLMKAIKAKASGKKIKAPAPVDEPTATTDHDLMAVLEESVARAAGATPVRRRSHKAPAKTPPGKKKPAAKSKPKAKAKSK